MALILISLAACLFSCDSSQHHGVTIAGVDTDAGCPIEIESCTITLDINELPQRNFSHQTYTSQAIWNYCFYNPSDVDVAMKLYLPFGQLPQYPVGYDYDKGVTTMTADGEPIEATAHCRYGEQDKENGKYYVSNERLTDAYFNENLKVYKYVYRLNITLDRDLDCLAQYRIYAPSKVLFDHEIESSRSRRDSVLVKLEVKDGEELTVYSFGEKISAFEQNVKFRERYGGDVQGCGVELLEETEITFEEIAFKYYDEATPFSRTEWYNAVVKKLQKNGVSLNLSVSQFNIEDETEKWYEYTLVIPAHKKVTHVVTAPMFPRIRWDYNPDLFYYDISLANLKAFKNVGTINVNADTSYYPIRKTQIALSMQGIEKTKLSLAFSSDPNPKSSTTMRDVFVDMTLALYILPDAIGIIIAVVVIIVTRKKKPKKDEQKND